jgi:uncharacterized membrane protein
MRFESKDATLTALFGSLYAVLVILQGVSAAAVIQLRFADCLIPLAALFGLPTILGVSIGCVISNAFLSASVPYGVYDILLGPVANLVAATVIFKLRKRMPLGCVLGALVVGLIVGSYIWLLFPPPPAIFGLALPTEWPPFALSVVSLTVSSLIAFGVLGYALFNVLSRPSIIEPLKSRGLHVYSEK